MTEDRTGRELTPRPEEPEGVVAPREPMVPAPSTAPGERFSAGEQAHTIGLTEERTAQIVRQSSNARFIAFLAVLIFVLFIPFYWLYDIGLEVLGVQSRLEKETDAQYVTDVKRGYALYLANCARCHDSTAGQPGNGLGNVGPPLNDQAKLYNVLTAQGLPGNGHLNPTYVHDVLEIGGRVVCGDPNSVMPAWLEPRGPLNYREIEEIIDFITASREISFSYVPAHVEGGATLPPPVQVEGWRDPTFTPAPGSTPVPACWRAPAAGGPTVTPGIVDTPGTVDNPRPISVRATDNLQWVDPATSQQVTAITVVEGETVVFTIENPSAVQHNFHIGSATDLAAAVEPSDLPGVDAFAQGTQTYTHTFTDNPDQPQFACTVPGHYQTMHGDFLIIPAGGGQPAVSPGTSPVAPPESGAPTPTASPTAAPASTP